MRDGGGGPAAATSGRQQGSDADLRTRSNLQGEINRLASTLGLLSDLTAGLSQLLDSVLLGPTRGNVLASAQARHGAAAPTGAAGREGRGRGG